METTEERAFVIDRAIAGRIIDVKKTFFAFFYFGQVFLRF